LHNTMDVVNIWMSDYTIATQNRRHCCNRCSSVVRNSANSYKPNSNLSAQPAVGFSKRHRLTFRMTRELWIFAKSVLHHAQANTRNDRANAMYSQYIGWRYITVGIAIF